MKVVRRTNLNANSESIFIILIPNEAKDKTTKLKADREQEAKEYGQPIEQLQVLILVDQVLWNQVEEVEDGVHDQRN